MPVNLLGLMAIATFYIVTVVVGLCAHRCLADEEGEEEDEDGRLRREHRSELELLELIESMGPPQSSNANVMDMAPEPSARAPPAVNIRFKPKLDDHDGGVNLDWSSRNNSFIAPHLHNSHQQSKLRRHLPADDSSSSSSSSPKKPLPAGGRFMLAEKNIGIILGSLSMLAIRTGGVFTNSIAQEVFDQGFIWCHVPIAASLSLILCGFLFSGTMYAQGYVTILDPFQDAYGVRAGAILFIPLLIADIIFSAVILSSLGALVGLALDLTPAFGTVCSLLSMLFYLLAGGLYAGTFTDAVQFLYLCFGLWLVLPFTLSNPSSTSVLESLPSWLGNVHGKLSGIYIDQFAMLVLGGIPMQSYFQRVLSSKSSKTARIITIVGSIGCLVNALPALLIGAAAASTEWGNTTLQRKVLPEEISLILPLCVKHLLPTGVMFLALGALASGLLASCDSCLFGLATLITQNLYRNWLRPEATSRELSWLCRLSVVVVSLGTLVLCLVWPHWHKHWLLPYDLLYVLVFPQLFCVIYFKYSNTYGAMAGLLVGTILRVLFGESKLYFNAPVRLPFWNDRDGQLFPYRTLAMLANLLTILIVSVAYHWLYKRGRVASEQDVFVCFANRRRRLQAQRQARNIEMPDFTSLPSSMVQDISSTSITHLTRPVRVRNAMEKMTVV